VPPGRSLSPGRGARRAGRRRSPFAAEARESRAQAGARPEEAQVSAVPSILSRQTGYETTSLMHSFRAVVTRARGCSIGTGRPGRQGRASGDRRGGDPGARGQQSRADFDWSRILHSHARPQPADRTPDRRREGRAGGRPSRSGEAPGAPHRLPQHPLNRTRRTANIGDCHSEETTPSPVEGCRSGSTAVSRGFPTRRGGPGRGADWGARGGRGEAAPSPEITSAPAVGEAERAATPKRRHLLLRGLPRTGPRSTLSGTRTSRDSAPGTRRSRPGSASGSPTSAPRETARSGRATEPGRVGDHRRGGIGPGRVRSGSQRPQGHAWTPPAAFAAWGRSPPARLTTGVRSRFEKKLRSMLGSGLDSRNTADSRPDPTRGDPTRGAKE